MSMQPGKRLYLAPMAEITTPALRRIIKEFCGEVVLFSEMLNAGSVVSGASHNEPLITRHEFDTPYIYQIVGNRPDLMSEAARILSDRDKCAININMGCAAPEIMKKGCGAGLLGDMDLAREIVRACRKSCDTELSVKMRCGYNSNDEALLLSFAKMLEHEGVDAIMLHPRHARLSFKRTADWRLVKLLKQHISIPVIGNGDIISPETAVSRQEMSGCNGIMIGRAAVQMPWIFRLCAYLLDREEGELTVDLQDVFTKVIDLIREYLPVNLHKSRFHRFCFYYTKNVTFSHTLFSSIRRTGDPEEIKTLVNDYFERNGGEKIKKYIVTQGKIYINK